MSDSCSTATTPPRPSGMKEKIRALTKKPHPQRQNNKQKQMKKKKNENVWVRVKKKKVDNHSCCNKYRQKIAYWKPALAFNLLTVNLQIDTNRRGSVARKTKKYINCFYSFKLKSVCVLICRGQCVEGVGITVACVIVVLDLAE